MSHIQDRVEQGRTLSTTWRCSWLTNILSPAPQLSLLTLRTHLGRDILLSILLACCTAQSILAKHRVFRLTLPSTGLVDVNTAYKPSAICSYHTPGIIKTDPVACRQVTENAAAMAAADEEIEEEETKSKEMAAHLDHCKLAGTLAWRRLVLVLAAVYLVLGFRPVIFYVLAL